MLTCDGNVSIGFSLLNHFKDLIRARDEPLGHTFDKTDAIFVFLNGQVDFGNCKGE